MLPDIFSGDPDALVRFEREARLPASLNHRDIAAIYGLEESGGKRFPVLELVEGETPAQRIAKEQIANLRGSISLAKDCEAHPV